MTKIAESVGQILERMSANRRWGRRLVEGQALLAWEDAVGEPLSAHSKPLRVRDGRLLVAVEDSIWKQEIGLLRSEIIGKLNGRIGSEVIREIVLIVR